MTLITKSWTLQSRNFLCRCLPEIAVQASATSVQGTTRRLYVENAALRLTGSGRAQFSGYIVNTGQRTINDYWVGVLLYDANGKIIGGGAQLFVKYWPVRPSERTPFSFEVYYGSPDFVSRKVCNPIIMTSLTYLTRRCDRQTKFTLVFPWASPANLSLRMGGEGR